MSRILTYGRVQLWGTPMNQTPLYPLRFEPVCRYRLWGGRRLSNLLPAALPDGPVGEAWLLSDRDDHSSVIAEGPLKGQTLGQILNQWPRQLLAGRRRVCTAAQIARCANRAIGSSTSL